ncbi:hypothetical protein TIFTF001_033166 [Ficus carica]|uniref:Uncharacterized protein n=1 Tax=Ficus carica TaxID=3494 RepID=A0AA88DZY7_FICCA|nr:hypothetical protein TIFTF001_033166 [Ficus carica]
MSHNSIIDGATDPKLFMEAMMGEMKRVMRLELEQIHERIDRMENTCVGQPQPAPNVQRRERVQPRHEAEDDKEFNEGGFEEEDERRSAELYLPRLLCPTLCCAKSGYNNRLSPVIPKDIGFVSRFKQRVAVSIPIEPVHRDDLGDFLDYGFRYKLAWILGLQKWILVNMYAREHVGACLESRGHALASGEP